MAQQVCVVLSAADRAQLAAIAADRNRPRKHVERARLVLTSGDRQLPIKPGRCQTMTHDYKRHGTTTLFAALSVLDGRVIGSCMQRHRHSEFIRFLNAVEREVPAGKLPLSARQLRHLVAQRG